MSDIPGALVVLRDLMLQASIRLGPLGIVRELKLGDSLGDANLFLVDSGKLLEGKGGEAVLIPASEDVYADKVFSKASEEWKELANYEPIFVDGFGVHKEEHPSSIPKVCAAELLDRVLGVKRYLYEYMEQREAKEVDRDYISRNMQLIDRTENHDYVIGAAGRAVEYFNEWAAKPSEMTASGILVLGERGAGKSWLLREFANVQNREFLDQPWSVRPAVYLPLSAYAKNFLHKKGIEKTLAYFIASRAGGASNWGLYFWDALIATGHVVLLLDGFDEISSEFTKDDLTEHIRLLGDSLPGRSRSIIASRSTRFASPELIFSIFQGAEPVFRESKPDDNTREQYIPDATVRQYIPAYQICQVTPFNDDDFISMSKTSSAKERVREIVRKRGGSGFIERQCCALASIPACAREMVFLIEKGVSNALRLFEVSLFKQLMISNIEAGRANVDITYIDRHTGQNTDEFGLAQRTRVLEHIAWSLIETNRRSFNAKLISFTYLEIENMQFEAVVNDLLTQTVFDCSYDDQGIRFVNDAIFTYFAARHVFTLLSHEDTREEGIKLLGLRDMSSPESGSLESDFLAFLSLFLDGGVMRMEAIEADYPPEIGEGALIRSESPLLADGWESLYRKNYDFAPQLRYLPGNVERIAPAIRDSSTLAACHDLNKKWKKEGKDLYLDGGILIAGRNGIPFILAPREETNADYKAFIDSPLKPFFKKIPGSPQRRRVVFLEEPGPHPLSWKSIHRSKKGFEDDFRYLTNDYHLFDWISDDVPSDQLDLPATWLSAFVIAVFCNWKTHQFCQDHQLEPEEHMVYQIELDDSLTPVIYIRPQADKPLPGYRMPTPDEWMHAARAGDYSHDYPWERFLASEKPRVKRKGELLKEHLTRPDKPVQSVYSSLPNDYGIYGMIGNVREWVFGGTPGSESKVQIGHIMGATALLGEDTFSYSHSGNPLPMYNTNLDVGFRWVRSIPEEIADDISELLNKVK